MEPVTFLTKVDKFARSIRGVMLAIVVLPIAFASASVPLQRGLSGAWHQTAIPGQGIVLEVYPDAVAPGIAYVQGSWLTFYVPGHWDVCCDTSANAQNWFSFSGAAPATAASVALTLHANVGGDFNAPPVTSAEPAGTVVLRFSDCTTASMDWALSDLSGSTGDPVSGTMLLTRLAPSITCTEDGAGTRDADFAHSGHWYDPRTAGQGMFFELNPQAGVVFMAWTTYAPIGRSLRSEGQRWYTGQASYTPGARTMPMTLYETTGGLRASAGGITRAVGFATATFSSCNEAMLSFTFGRGSSAGMGGRINLKRLAWAPADCGP